MVPSPPKVRIRSRWSSRVQLTVASGDAECDSTTCTPPAVSRTAVRSACLTAASMVSLIMKPTFLTGRTMPVSLPAGTRVPSPTERPSGPPAVTGMGAGDPGRASPDWSFEALSIMRHDLSMYGLFKVERAAKRLPLQVRQVLDITCRAFDGRARQPGE